MATRGYTLTEEDKLNIIHEVRTIGKQWTIIGRKYNINPNSCRSFYNSYLTHGTLNPKMGRPVKIDDNKKREVIDAFEQDPETGLRDIAATLNISHTTIKKILNADKIQYFEKIAVPPLTPLHKQNRVQFALRFSTLNYEQLPIIIFTDESTVEANMRDGGVWRRRGEYPHQAFYEKVGHPIHCMVWGAIGPRGFRTILARVQGNMDADGYIRLLTSNGIHTQIYNRFGFNFTFQQDNAKPHIARRIQGTLHQMFPNILQWPAKSPDLSPIEQLWEYLKNRIAGVKFTDADQLFQRLQTEWARIPDSVIHNAYSSFLARCQVCVNIGGENLNGHWKEVHKLHDNYRTKLHYQFNQNLQLIATEEPFE